MRTGRPPKVNYYESKGQYAVTIRGKRHLLGADPEEAERTFRFLIQEDGQGTEATEANPFFRDVAEAWLEHVQRTQAQDRYRNVRARLKEFGRLVGRGTRVDELRPAHVEKWIAKKQPIKPGTERLYKGMLLACLNWAAGSKSKGAGGLIAHNPLRGRLVLPEGDSRGGEVLWAEKVWNQVVKHANPAFASVVRILRWTGCRPSLVCRIEARHYNPVTKTWDVADLNPPNPRAKKRTRRVWLSDQAQELILKQNIRHPAGPIFRNAVGGPWTSAALQIYLYNMMTKFRETKNLPWPRGLCVYGLRHSFATDFIKQYPDKIEYLRELLGHKDLEMIRKHYGHLFDEHGALHATLNAMNMPA